MQESLGRKLRLMRAERGLSLREAARRAGVVKETISEIERGRTHPYDVTLAKLAHAYDVPVEELLEEPVPLAKAPDQGQQGRARIAAIRPTGRGPNVTPEMLAELGIEATDAELNALNIYLEGRARQRVEGGPTSIVTLGSDNVDHEKVVGWVDAVEGAFPDWIARRRFNLASGSEATRFETLVDITLERIRRAALEGRKALDDMVASDALAGIDPELHEAYAGLLNESLNLVEEFDKERKSV